jgi:hypothetical protein
LTAAIIRDLLPKRATRSVDKERASRAEGWAVVVGLSRPDYYSGLTSRYDRLWSEHAKLPAESIVTVAILAKVNGASK